MTDRFVPTTVIKRNRNRNRALISPIASFALTSLTSLGWSITHNWDNHLTPQWKRMRYLQQCVWLRIWNLCVQETPKEKGENIKKLRARATPTRSRQPLTLSSFNRQQKSECIAISIFGDKLWSWSEGDSSMEIGNKMIFWISSLLLSFFLLIDRERHLESNTNSIHQMSEKRAPSWSTSTRSTWACSFHHCTIVKLTHSFTSKVKWAREMPTN